MMIGIRWAVLVLTTALCACAPRGDLETADAFEEATVKSVFVAQFRQETGQLKSFGERRPNQLTFQRIDVSIPPTH